MEKNEAKVIIKEAVEEAIRYCGTQTSLAEKAEISQGAIGKYIRLEAMPTGVTAKKLNLAVENSIPLHRFAPLIFDHQAA